MNANNRINSPTSSLGWTSFIPTITAATPPNFGSTAVIKSYYLQEGKVLFLTLFINPSGSGVSGGSGTYVFSIPSGFTMNTAITGVTTAPPYFGLGSATAYAVGNGAVGSGTALAYSATQYVLLLDATNPQGQINFVGSSWFSTSSYAASLLIPII